MADLLAPLTLYQWGRESATPANRGTAVAATSKIAVEKIEFEAEDELWRPALAKGLLIPHSGNEMPTMRGTRFRITDQPVNYSQLHHWLSMAVVGAVTAVGASDPYTWTFARSITADPAPETFTIERRLSDGTNFVDLEWVYCFLTSITFTFEQNQPAKMSAEGVARRVQASTLTAALSMPTIDMAPSPLAKVWLDATWATLGTTALATMVRKATCTFKTGLKPLFTLDARTDLDFNTYILDPNEVGTDLELTVLPTKTFYDAEKAAAEARTLRAIKILVDGPTADRSLTLNMLVKHVPGSFIGADEDEGQVQTVYRFQESTDGTNLFSAVVENGVNVYT